MLRRQSSYGCYGGVNPDLAVFAKGLTNGYPLSAIVGKGVVMSAAQSTFISSTYYTERVGFAASLKNIEVYQRERVWEKQILLGKKVKSGWRRLADKHGVSIEIGGIDPLAHFSFQTDDFLAYKTYITQEMLKKGYLASNAFYSCCAHTEEIVEAYLDALDGVFKRISEIMEKKEKISDFLDGPVCQSGFQRLN